MLSTVKQSNVLQSYSTFGRLAEPIRCSRRILAFWLLAVGSAFPIVLCGCAMPPGPGPGGGGTDAVAREIEEADIIKLEDGYMYVANPYSGLRIIDARIIESPVMMGSVPLGGRGVELFVRENLAFVFTAADFLSCAGQPVGFADGAFGAQLQPDYDGSRLWVIDVSDKDAPEVTSTFDFNGFVTGTRRVGDVIYAAGNINWANIDQLLPDDPSNGLPSGPGVFVTSINIADAGQIFEVETEAFSGLSLDIHVSGEAMYAIGSDPTMDEVTRVTYVDVADPDGDIVVRDQFRVPGEVENRFFVDEHEGVFRIITEEFVYSEWVTVVALYTYDVADPDDVVRLARLPIITDESLRAVRFDGPRGYAVTFVRIDPLFVIDLSDPQDPQVTGELEVPGFSTHLVPLGERLVGVGFDTTAGTRPAVALYDVANPTNPRQLARIMVGDRFTSDTGSAATVDEKALRVIEDAGLILLPFSTFDRETARYTDALQLIGLEQTTLRERGTIEHRGFVRRADLLDERIWVLSDEAFQTVDIEDLDSPASLAVLDITSEQELLDAGMRDCAQAARDTATPVTAFWDGGCGFVGPLFIPLMFSGLGLLKLGSRRRKRWAS